MSGTEILFDRPIAYHRLLAKISGGGVTAGVLLSQAYYWSLRTKDPDGWFYKSYEDWEEETGLTRSEFETARKHLIQNKLIEYKLKGIPAVGHYRVIHARVLFLSNQYANKIAENLQTGLGETCKQDEAIPANINKSAETTTEITTEIKQRKGADAPIPQKKKRRIAPKEKATKDPNMEHPAVKAYREIVKLTPNEIQRRTLAEKVSDFAAWRKTLVSWMLHGWSPRNIEGMINSYETGGNGNGRAYAPAAQQSFEDIPIFQGRRE